MSLYTFFGNTYKKLVMIVFSNYYNLCILAKEKTNYKIPHNQICIDLLQITNGYTGAGHSVSHKLVFKRIV